MDQWSSRKGRDGIRQYWAEKNVASIDGLSGIDTVGTAITRVPLVAPRLDVQRSPRLSL